MYLTYKNYTYINIRVFTNIKLIFHLVYSLLSNKIFNVIIYYCVAEDSSKRSRNVRFIFCVRLLYLKLNEANSRKNHV